MKSIIFFGLLIVVLASVVSATQITILEIDTATNQTNTSGYIVFDRNASIANHSTNITFGTDRYLDYSPENLNAVLTICHPNMTTGMFVDMAYYSENRTLLKTLTNILPQITSTYSGLGNTSTCTRIDVDSSVAYAFYPGYVVPVLVPANYTLDYEVNQSEVYVLPRPNTSFNGSYELQINVDGPPKEYEFRVDIVYDDEGQEISTINRNYLVVSFVNENGTSLVEQVRQVDQPIAYTGSLQTGDQIIVNGIPSLTFISIDPCNDQINDSGYYVFNNSGFNQNDTCLVVENQSNVLVNFAGEIIDGDDDNVTGSKVPGKCAIEIRNSQNVVFDNFVSQQYYHGLCIINSTVALFGNNLVDNSNGVLLNESSYAKLSQFTTRNTLTEMIVEDGSILDWAEVNFSYAFTSGHLQAGIVNDVFDFPPLPNITNITDINQSLQVTNLSNESWSQITFIYPDPIPNNVTPANASIYKYNGTFAVYYEVNNGSLINRQNWGNGTNGTWEQLFTLIAPQTSEIIGPNITDFSVFMPLAFPLETSEDPTPEPTPEPEPDPDPESGASGGGGSSPASPLDDDEALSDQTSVELILDIPTNVTVMQGEAINVEFNITNRGNGVVPLIRIGPTPPNGWEYLNATVPGLRSGESQEGTFQLAPYEQVFPDTYLIPVSAWIVEGLDNVRAVTEVLRVQVIPRGDLKRIRIIEYPPEITVPPFSTRNISFLVNNIGDFDLENISIKLDPSECILDIQGQNSIEQGVSRSLSYEFFFGEETVCTYNVKFFEGEDIVGFVPLSVTVEPLSFTAREIVQISIAILVLLAWTLLTMRILRIRSRRIYKDQIRENDNEESYY